MNTKTVNDVEKAIEAQAAIAATSADVKEVAAGLKLVQMGTKAISDDDKTTHEIALANKRFELEKKKQESSHELEVKKYELDKKSKEDQLALDERKLESQEKKDASALRLDRNRFHLEEKKLEEEL